MAQRIRSRALQRFLARQPQASFSVLAMLGAGFVLSNQVQAQSPRVPSNALPVQAPDWLQRGTAATYSTNGSQATVGLSGPATILHWRSLDVGAGARLNFNLPTSTSRVLNKVDGGAWQNKTTIEGALNANGQVYIYNPNGILFGRGSTVNVNTLVASSLKLDDQRFMDGLISPSTAANLARDPALGASFVPGAVEVEGGSADGLTQRAAITAQQYGMILLAAPQVSNSGLLSAPDGQVALAAGAKLYLVAPTDNAMRGLRVEVNSDGLAALSGAAPSATNTATGVIDVKRGNITMVGLAVNQSGIASATTSVSLNGSIVLRAQDGASKTTAQEIPQPKVGGTLTLGPGSSTLVLPDLQDIDAQTGKPRTALGPPAGPGFKPSTVTLGGQTIRLEKDAQVRAPGGQVSVDARSNPDPNATAQAPTASRVELASGSVIDVAGSSDVPLDMDSNVITAELRGGELADNVLLRDSAVRGKTVRFDARKARKNGIAVANLDGYLNQQTQTVGEFTAAGGTVSIKSEGDLWLRAGSLVNVSGGSVQYQAGYVNTSKLSLGGRLYDLETAPANLPYDGVVNLANSTQNFELGYREGRSAGTVTLAAPRMALSGSLSGQLSLGEQQRDRGAAGAPLGGQLILGSAAADPLSLARDLQLRGGIDLSGKPATYYRKEAPITRGASDDGQGALQLDVMALGLAGFNRFTLGTTGGIGLSEPLSLPLAGRLSLKARGDIRLAADLQIPGGSLSASTTPAQLVVGGGDKPIRLDVAGEWQNDLLRDAVAPAADALSHPNGSFITRGGSISLSANLLTLSQAALDVSGGAALDVAGKLSAGKAGSISLQVSPFNLPGDEHLTLGKDLTLAGYGLTSGGSLSLTAPNVTVGRSTGDPSALLLDPLFFSQGGFTSRTVSANGNLSVQAGMDIHATAASWVLSDNAASLGGHSMGDVAATARLPLAGPRGARPASSLSLLASGPRLPGDGQGRLTVGTDALVQVDAGGTISLLADNQLTVNGTLSAPAGQISLLLNAPVPQDAQDNAYDATRSIWLGAQGRLLAQGSKARVYTDNAGLTVGDVLDGGSVRIGRLQDGQLSVAAATVVTEQGSLIDVSGTWLTDARLKSGGSVLAPQTLGSAGGSIDIRAREGLLLAGSLRGEAGSDAARGGSLSVMLDGEGKPGGSKYPKGPRQLFISTADPGSVLPAGLRPGDALPSQVAQGVLPLATFAQGGFSRLALSSEDQLGFIGDVALSVGSSLSLNAPVVAAGTPGQQVRLDAPYISLGNTVLRDQEAPLGSGGNAALTVRAGNLDLTGQIATQGYGRVTLAASEDIRLNGVAKQDGPYTTGALSTGPALDLLATRIYPSTLSHFDIGLTGADSTLRFGSTGGATAPVLSAAGSLSAHADRILQGGQVYAPFGQISLVAKEEISYLPGSLTSVAGSGPVPFGTVTNGTDWSYQLGGQTLVFKAKPSADPLLGEYGLPQKSVLSQAPKVTQAAGAVLDASGGGSLMAYEFTPGPGGSGDVLASTGAGNQRFAINAAYKGGLAPLDPQYGQDGLKAGDQVYLSGSPGLPAGYYTLLPAHYALLPGGYAIEPLANSRDMSALDNRQNLDGSLVIAGRRVSGTDQRGDTRTAGFRLTPPDLIRRSSEFHLYDADGFFKTQAARDSAVVPGMPADGGQLTFSVQNSLALAGRTVLAGAAQGGRRGMVDIAAPDILVASGRGDAGSGSGSPGAVTLSAPELVALGADSLLLGGRRTFSDDGVHLQVVANSVRVDNDGAHALTGPELLLAARDSVQLTGRASVQVQGVPEQLGRALTIDGQGLQADGALLRVSGGASAPVLRSAPAGVQGRLDIQAGAQVGGGASQYLDGTASMSLDGGLTVSPGASLVLRAPQINLGATAPRSSTGITLGTDGLSQWSRLAELDLLSYGGIDVWGTVALGGAGMRSMALGAQALRGHEASLLLQAQNLSLTGTGPADAAGPVQQASDLGSLSIRADTVQLGQGVLRVQGFAKTDLQAQGDLQVTGQATRLLVDNDLTLRSARISAGAGADARIQSGGATNLVATEAGQTTAAAGLGGKIAFHGQTLTSTAWVAAPAGRIELGADQGVEVRGGLLDVGGVSVAFGSGAASAPAGAVVLDGGAGDVTVGQAARLNLSAQGADAGELQISGRSARLDLPAKQLSGSAALAAGATAAELPAQGVFALDVAQSMSTVDLQALNTKLNQAGFTGARSIKVHEGDLNVAGEVVARRISLSADNGNLTVSGTLNANGPSGGSIELFAAQADASGSNGRVTLTATGRVSAAATRQAPDAAGSVGAGGRVILGAANADGSAPTQVNGGASISLEAGSDIQVAGSGPLAKPGFVTLRAPRTRSGTDVAIAVAGAKVSGGDLSVEAVKTYRAERISEQPDSATNLDATLSGRMAGDASDFMLGAAAVANRLGRSDIGLNPGIEVRSAGDLTVSVNEQSFDPGRRGWDLQPWRFAGRGGTLSLRAGGQLNILGAISDGFERPSGSSAMPDWTLGADTQGWNLRLVGGADLGAANPMGTLAPGRTGDVRLGFARPALDNADAPVALVRTGVGRIDIAAARDIRLDTIKYLDPDGDTTFDRDYGAAIYTAGRAVTPQGDFKAPLNAAFGTQGGAVDVQAGRDVVGAPMAQMVNQWLFRQGRSGIDTDGVAKFEQVRQSDGSTQTLQTAWWVRPGYFSGGVATFGGGDLSIRALTGSVRDLAASVASSAYTTGLVLADSRLVEQGGGDLSVRAGQDILGGQFFVQKGRGQLRAARDVAAGSVKALDVLAPPEKDAEGNLVRDADGNLVDVYTPMKPVLALGDAQIAVTAGGSLQLESVYNPTLTRQSRNNVAGNPDPDSPKLLFGNRSGEALGEKSQFAQFSAFSTYGKNSAVALTAVSGDLQLSNNATLMAYAGGPDVATASGDVSGQAGSFLYAYYPASLSAAALSGKLSTAQGMALAPSPVGQLELLAGQSIALHSNGISFNTLTMLDNDPASVSRARAPALLTDADRKVMSGKTVGLAAHTPGQLHAADAAPARLVALKGDITGQADQVATIVLPKSAEILAGRDIRDLGFSIQNLRAGDETVVRAGRDLMDSTNVEQSGVVQHQLGGPGLLTINAGRHIDLGNAAGVVTRGNLDNAYLPEGGASIVALAGVATPAASAQQTPAAKISANETLFKQLVVTGGPATLPAFDALIDEALPLDAQSGGDIRVFGSQFKTEQGGSIDLLAPAGSVIAGLVSVPSYLDSKPASEIGIFTVRGGAIRGLVRDDFVVNQGRVFTLGGGDITLVSRAGNIDAGRGTKTASSAPPPLLTTDEAGNTRLDLAGSVSGSGIATLRTSDTQPASNVYAVAPRGIFDAGDAGVRSTGTVGIQAAVVLNAGNISASAGVSGSVGFDAGAAPAAPATPAGAVSSATDATRQVAIAPKDTLPLSVEVLGFGDAEDDTMDNSQDSPEEKQRKKRARDAKSVKKP